MEFKIGNNKIGFREDFKPKSLTLFLETYGYLGSKKDITDIFKKLNGDPVTTKRKSKKAK